MATATKVTVQYQSGSSNTVFATWTWNGKNTDKYQVYWEYDTGDGVWFVDNPDSSVTIKQSTYSIPENAKRVRFRVKPVSKTYKKNKVDTYYWTCTWSTAVIFNITSAPPETPSAPSVSITNEKLTVRIDKDYAGRADHINFYIVEDDKRLFKSVNVGLSAPTSASYIYTVTVSDGHKYKVRARAYKQATKVIYSAWSDYSENVQSRPGQIANFSEIKVLTETSVRLTWPSVSTADTYKVEYTDDPEYFDSSDQVQSKEVTAPTHHVEITGIESGKKYYFRVRATNSGGDGKWSPIKDVIIGTKPEAPTTWSYTTTVTIGEPAVLNWTHNTADSSDQEAAEIEIVVGSTTTTITKTTETVHNLDTAGYSDGTEVLWRVRTKGIAPDYSEWSAQRSIHVYTQPSVSIASDDILSGTFTSYPFDLTLNTDPDSQTAISMYVTIVANSSYDILDEAGSDEVVTVGQTIFSQYYNEITDNTLVLSLTAGDLRLENNADYILNVTAAMSNGLTAENSVEFTTAFAEDSFNVEAEIGIDEENICATIRPYCTNDAGTIIRSVYMSVYRREYDGQFTLIESDLDGELGTTILDPHPALDYARYRIVAVSKDSGLMVYNDIPGIPMNVKSIVIQWDENWGTFDSNEANELTEAPWKGTMLKLPYNVDISNDVSPDVELVEYIGRANPVAYYGTQRGESGEWEAEIPKSDTNTIYLLRKLSVYTGDVYIREPSGIGYWANITVSFKIEHKKTTIPVSFSVKRVDGGA